MAGFYDQMQGIATGLLTDLNQGQIALVRLIPGTGPIHNPGPPTPARTPLKGAARPAKGAVLLEPGSLIVAGDLRVVTAVVDGINPTTGDKIEIDGVSFTIIRFDPTPPAGITVAWVFYVRRS